MDIDFIHELEKLASVIPSLILCNWENNNNLSEIKAFYIIGCYVKIEVSAKYKDTTDGIYTASWVTPMHVMINEKFRHRRAPTVWLHLHAVQKREKLIYDYESQNVC